ncbi:metallophosphoesterase family protein [bacterium]|nr:metallophosphoesterase family protein [bacterium]
MSRIAVLSDIHSNLHALTAVWRRIEEIGIDAVYCCGDVVGYGARPVECLEMIRERGVTCVQGNHDALVADGSLSLDFNIYSLAAVEHNRGLLNAEQLQWLADLPTYHRLDREVLFVHGAPCDRDKYLVYLDDLQEASERVMNEDGPGVCFFGHTHHPVIFDGHGFERVRQATVTLEHGQRNLANPGSVGQPRDNDPRSSFLWWDRSTNLLNYERVEYDVQGARQDILDADLPRILGDRLLEGR